MRRAINGSVKMHSKYWLGAKDSCEVIELILAELLSEKLRRKTHHQISTQPIVNRVERIMFYFWFQSRKKLLIQRLLAFIFQTTIYYHVESIDFKACKQRVQVTVLYQANPINPYFCYSQYGGPGRGINDMNGMDPNQPRVRKINQCICKWGCHSGLPY